jgi:hypothetical protein
VDWDSHSPRLYLQHLYRILLVDRLTLAALHLPLFRPFLKKLSQLQLI